MDYLIVKLDEKNIEVAYFTFNRSQVELKGAQVFELNTEQTLSTVAASIASALAPSTRVVLLLPPSQVAQRLVNLPLKDLRKVREVLPVHLQGETLLSADELAFEALPAEPGLYLALWTKKSECRRFIEIFESAGCVVNHISSAPYSLWVLPGVLPDDALFDGTTFVQHSGGLVTSSVTFNGENCFQQLQTHIAAMELSSASMPKRLLIFGEALKTQLSSLELPIPLIQLACPDELGAVFKNEETFQRLAAFYAVSVATHEGRLADFRRGELVNRSGDAVLRKKILTTALLAIIVIILLFAVKIMQYRAVNNDLSSLNRSITALYHEMFPGRKAVDEVAEIKGEIKKLSGGASSNSLLDLCKRLAEAKGVSINGLFEVEMDGETVRLKGDSNSAKGASDFVIALADVLQPAQLGETKSRPDGTVSFIITGKLKGGK